MASPLTYSYVIDTTTNIKAQSDYRWYTDVSNVNACSIARLAITFHVADDKDVSWKGYTLAVWA